MPLNFHPGISPSVAAPVANPVRSSPVKDPAAHRVEVEPLVVEERGTERSAKRSAEYVAALRELREEQQAPQHNLATRTYLQIAHYEGDFQLVDVYT